MTQLRKIEFYHDSKFDKKKKQKLFSIHDVYSLVQ